MVDRMIKETHSSSDNGSLFPDFLGWFK